MLDQKTIAIFSLAHNYAQKHYHEYMTSEHILLFLMDVPPINDVIIKLAGNVIPSLQKNLTQYLDKSIPKTNGTEPIVAEDVHEITAKASIDARGSGKTQISPEHIFIAIFRALDDDSFAKTILESYNITKLGVMREFSHGDYSSDKENKNEKATDSPSEKSKTDSFLVNLNEKAKNLKIDPMIGRNQEVERMVHTLVRRKKNNPILVGEPGVGKTAIVEGLALKIVKGEVPSKLKDVIIYSVDLAAMLAGTKHRGDFEQKMNDLLKRIEKEPNSVLFFDEIHTMIGAGAVSGGTMDASNMLKPKLASGQLRVIGATTYKEYRNVFEKDTALARRFQKVDVVEPSVEDAIQILTGLKGEFEKHHKVTYSDSAIRSAVELSVKHINDRFLPDKAIDLLDEAGATLSLHDKEGTVDKDLIEKMIAKIARIPEKTVSTSQKDKLKNLESDIKMVLYGQDEAVRVSVEAIELSKAGLRSGTKPISSMLFVGPTGVGKTELVKQLSLNLGIPLLRFDMSEYMEKHSVSRLVGSPPGYVGHNEEGQLTGKVMKNPHSIVLFDEMEKAHPDIYNLLLQIMDYGTLTDSVGRKADFKNTIIIMTSNTGAKEASKTVLGIGQSAESSYKKPVQAVSSEFTPEFRNRLDAVVYFNPLSHDNVVSVLDKYILDLEKMLIDKNVSVDFSKEAKEYLIEKGYDSKMGARPMQRALEDYVSRKLAKEILYGKLENGGEVKVVIKDGEIAFEFKKSKAVKKTIIVEEPK